MMNDDSIQIGCDIAFTSGWRLGRRVMPLKHFAKL